MRAPSSRLTHPSAGAARDRARRDIEGTSTAPDVDDPHHHRHRSQLDPVGPFIYYFLHFHTNSIRPQYSSILHLHDGCRNVCNYRLKFAIAIDNFKGYTYVFIINVQDFSQLSPRYFRSEQYLIVRALPIEVLIDPVNGSISPPSPVFEQ